MNVFLSTSTGVQRKETQQIALIYCPAPMAQKQEPVLAIRCAWNAVLDRRNGPTDLRKDGQTYGPSYRDATAHLKNDPSNVDLVVWEEELVGESVLTQETEFVMTSFYQAWQKIRDQLATKHESVLYTSTFDLHAHFVPSNSFDMPCLMLEFLK